MFKKLLSNLPFNPSLINQVSFYAGRMQQEEKLRRTGVILVALALFVQTFAVMSPPQPSLAASPNDIVYGGFNTASQLADIYDSGCDSAGRCDIKQVFRYFGISSSAQIRSGRMVTITDVDQYHTYGRTISSKGYIRQHNANGTTVYERNLGVWSPRSWQALEVINDRGHKVWILNSCGNPTTTPQGDPSLNIEKQSVPRPNEKVRNGDEITYKLFYRNSGNNVARNFHIKDSLPSQVELVRWGNFGADKTRSANNLMFFHGGRIPDSTLGVSPSNLQVNFVVKVRDNAAPGRFCNTATIHAIGQEDKRSNEVCHVIVEPCPHNPALPADDPRCEPPEEETPTVITEPAEAKCVDLRTTFLSRNRVRFHLTGTKTGAITVDGFKLELGDGNTVDVNAGNPGEGVFSATYTHTYPEEGPKSYRARSMVVTNFGNQASVNCIERLTIEKPLEPKIVISKKASNTTQSIDDANNSTAKPGDELTYTITAENVGDGPESSFVFPEDDITNILDYADLTDDGGANVVESDGITKLVWENPVEIGTGESVSQEFKVRIKEKLPQTNTPASDPERFDCQITNSLTGENNADDTVVVKFDFALCKPVEQVVTTLPETGPASSTFLVFLVAAGTSYFLARTRLMRKELEIVRSDYAVNNSEEQ